MRGRKSIFDLERRSDLLTDYSRLIEDMKKATIHSKSMKDRPLYAFLDESIQDWPFRQATSSMNLYLSNLNVNKPGEEIIDTIYSLELIINLLEWAPIHDANISNPLSGLTWDCDVSSVCNRFIENIEFILEQNNMAVREFGKEAPLQYRIYKRRAEVDAALESVPELSELLLSYLDVRNENDEAHKKLVLKELADYLEPRRKQYNGGMYKGLSDDVFTVFNKCNIRHNDANQVKLRKPQRMKLYDNTFKMCLHLLQVEEVSDYKKQIKELLK